MEYGLSRSEPALWALGKIPRARTHSTWLAQYLPTSAPCRVHTHPASRVCQEQTSLIKIPRPFLGPVINGCLQAPRMASGRARARARNPFSSYRREFKRSPQSVFQRLHSDCESNFIFIPHLSLSAPLYSWIPPEAFGFPSSVQECISAGNFGSSRCLSRPARARFGADSCARGRLD